MIKVIFITKFFYYKDVSTNKTVAFQLLTPLLSPTARRLYSSCKWQETRNTMLSLPFKNKHSLEKGQRIQYTNLFTEGAI